MIGSFISYVVSAPGFYPGIGMTVASGMFVGSTIYNGELPMLRKGLWTLGFYSVFLLIINVMRVVDSSSKFFGDPHFQPEMAWASTNTILFVTLAYLIGMLLGVLITKKAHRL